jgi:hypothetical protein
MTKIKFERSGGFAGITLSSELDPAALPEEEAEQARKLIDGANLFEQPKQMKSRSPQPDSFEYKITIQEKGKRRTIVVGDRSAPANLKPLLDYLVERAKK